MAGEFTSSVDCGRQAEVFHVFRLKMYCSACAVRHLSREAAALMPVHIANWGLQCRFIDCNRTAKYRGTRSGDLVCATHSEGIPQQLLTEDLGNPSPTVDVEVSLDDKTSESWDLIPVIETANALGQCGYRVFDLSWVGDNPDSKRILLRIEEFAGAARSPELYQRQIALLEEQYKASQSRVESLTQHNTRINKENSDLWDQRRELLNTQASLEADIRDLQIQLQQVLADGRLEPNYIPVLTTKPGERSI
jgi:hypothetical protein